MSDVLRRNQDVGTIAPENLEVEAVNSVPSDQHNKSTTGKNDFGKLVSFSVGEFKIYTRLKMAEVSEMDDTTGLLYVVGEASNTEFPSEVRLSGDEILTVDPKVSYLRYMSNLLDKLSGGGKQFTPEQVEKKLGKIATDEQEMIKPDGFKYELQYTALSLLVGGAVKALRPNVVESQADEPARESISSIQKPAEPKPKTKVEIRNEWAASNPDINDPKPEGWKGPHPAVLREIEDIIEGCRILASELGSQQILDEINQLEVHQKISKARDADRTLKSWESRLVELRQAKRDVINASKSKPEEQEA